mgnify:CR=1 FL=1
MSRIAEQRSLAEYPEDYAYSRLDDDDTDYTEIDGDGVKWLKIDANRTIREGYAKGYSHALDDIKLYVKQVIGEQENRAGALHADIGLYTILGHIVLMEEER